MNTLAQSLNWELSVVCNFTQQNVQCGVAPFQCRSAVRRSRISGKIICVIRIMDLTTNCRRQLKDVLVCTLLGTTYQAHWRYVCAPCKLTIFIHTYLLYYAGSAADPKILKRREMSLSAPFSSCIANAHNEMYAFCTEKRPFEKNMSQ